MVIQRIIPKLLYPIFFFILFIFIAPGFFHVNAYSNSDLPLFIKNNLGSFLDYNYVDSPRGIAIDGSNNIYVADYGHSRVQIYKPDGSLLRSIGSAGTTDGKFQGVSAIAVADSGNIYVGDGGRGDIQVFNSNGEFLRKFDGTPQTFFSIYAITVDSSENVYVVDLSAQKIKKYTSTGTFVTSWGQYSPGENDHMAAGNITFRNDKLIYVDLAGVVHIFDTDGNFIDKFEDTGSPLFEPRAGFVDNDNNVYVGGSTNFRKYDINGNLLFDNDALSYSEGSQGTIWGIVVDNSGNVYTSIEEHDIVRKFDSSGSYTRVFC